MSNDFGAPETPSSAWQRLGGKLAPAILHAPWKGAASNPTEGGLQMDQEIVTLIERRLLGTPWANHLALVAVVMAARNQETAKIVEVVTTLHGHWSSFFRTLSGTAMEDWHPEGAAHVFMSDPTHPDQHLQLQTAFLQCYSTASWHIKQWLATLPQPQQEAYASFCLPPLPLHDAGDAENPGSVSLLESSRPFSASRKQRTLTSSHIIQAVMVHAPFELRQVQVLLEAAVRRPHATRDVSLLALLLETGMRVSELATLTWQDVRLEEQMSSVWLRSRKDQSPRCIPLSPQMRDALLRYRSSLAQKAPMTSSPEASGEPHSPDQRHEPIWRNHQGAALSARGIRRILASLAQNCGMPPPTGSVALRLRATCIKAYVHKHPGDLVGLATLLGVQLQTAWRAQLDCNPRIMGMMLGHRSPTQFLHYTHLDPPASFDRLDGFDAGTNT